MGIATAKETKAARVPLNSFTAVLGSLAELQMCPLRFRAASSAHLFKRDKRSLFGGLADAGGAGPRGPIWPDDGRYYFEIGADITLSATFARPRPSGTLGWNELRIVESIPRSVSVLRAPRIAHRG